MYTNPKLREEIKNVILKSGKGGRPGQWSARKAQLVAHEYEKAGGGYIGPKTKSQKSLSKWTKERWGTASGRYSIIGPNATGERYLPEKARRMLSPKEYRMTSELKRKGTLLGLQYVPQPAQVLARLRSCPRCGKNFFKIQ